MVQKAAESRSRFAIQELAARYSTEPPQKSYEPGANYICDYEDVKNRMQKNNYKEAISRRIDDKGYEPYSAKLKSFAKITTYKLDADLRLVGLLGMDAAIVGARELCFLLSKDKSVFDEKDRKELNRIERCCIHLLDTYERLGGRIFYGPNKTK